MDALELCNVLPAMHERYGYLLDVVLVICAFKDKRFVIISALDIFISLSAYSIFLFNVNVVLFQLMALIYFVLYLIATYLVFNNLQLIFTTRLILRSYRLLGERVMNVCSKTSKILLSIFNVLFLAALTL